MNTSGNPLRPLTAGELADQAIVMWRRNLGAFFRLYLPFNLLTYSVSKMGTLLMVPYLAALKNTREPEDVLLLLQKSGPGLALMVVLFIVAMLVAWLALLGGSRFAVRAALGQPETMGASVRRMVRRAPTLIFALFLAGLLWCVVFAISLAPGGVLVGFAAIRSEQLGKISSVGLIVIGVILILFGMLFAVLWFFLRVFLLPPVVAEEHGGVLNALKRSGQLMSGRVGPGLFGFVKVRASILLSALTVILMVIASTAQMPALFIQFHYGGIGFGQPPNPDLIPQALLIPAELFAVVVQALFGSISLTLAALFYVDLRVRREGLDLETRLQALPPQQVATP